MTDLPPIEQIRLAHPEGSLVRKLAEELERERTRGRYKQVRLDFIEAKLRDLAHKTASGSPKEARSEEVG